MPSPAPTAYSSCEGGKEAGMPGGKGRKRKESCEGAEEDLADAPPPRYELRTPILGFHRKQLYAGMAIKRRRRDDSWQYLVHYNGWGAKYDEWVNEDLLYPDTDESRRVAESLRTSAEQQEKQRLARKDEADAMAEDLGSEYVIQIIIPHTLQTHLLKEADFVKDGKVVPLPRKPCVRKVLSDFIVWKAETCQDMLEVEKEILRDLTESIISYFDKALGMMLLYKEERAQYNKWRAANPGAAQCDFYGTEHLLRLVAKLPSLLQDAKLSPETGQQIHPRLMELLRYIERNASSFLLSAYQPAIAI